jgi:hypothetical protein
MGVPQNAWSIVENHGKSIYTWMTRATPMTKRKPPYFSSGSIPQDTEMQVVIVGAGRADLVAQTKVWFPLLDEGTFLWW